MPYYVRAPTDIPTDLSTEIVDTFTACRALHPFADRPSTSILKLNGSRYRLKMNEMQKTYERPAWLKRVQNHGLTPAGLEEYLKAGWPLSAIATDRNLDVEDVLNAAERWDISLDGAA
jgi:hypothetical protein